MRSWTRLRGDLRTDADGLRIAEVMLDARRRQVLRRAVIAARARVRAEMATTSVFAGRTRVLGPLRSAWPEGDGSRLWYIGETGPKNSHSKGGHYTRYSTADACFI